MRHVPWIGKKRKRPRLCAVCHEDASYVEVGMYQLSIVDRVGSVAHQEVPKGTYYCAEHTGMVG